MDNFKYLIYEKTENVAWLTINRPEVYNAMNDALRREIFEALEDSRDDDSVRVIVITGSGDKAFSAGADISEFPKLNSADQVKRHYGKTSVTNFLRQIPKPIIAMVNGLALGGGCELVMACDIVIASDAAKFGQPEVRVGVIPGAGGTQVLPRLIGEKKAKELIFTGMSITANEALQMGMINRVVPAEKLKESVTELVSVLVRRSPVILKIAKAAVNRSLETTLSTGLLYESDLFGLCFGTADQKEGAKAFLEKREPKYEGK